MDMARILPPGSAGRRVDKCRLSNKNEYRFDESPARCDSGLVTAQGCRGFFFVLTTGLVRPDARCG